MKKMKDEIVNFLISLGFELSGLRDNILFGEYGLSIHILSTLRKDVYKIRLFSNDKPPSDILLLGYSDNWKKSLNKYLSEHKSFRLMIRDHNFKNILNEQ